MISKATFITPVYSKNIFLKILSDKKINMADLYLTKLLSYQTLSPHCKIFKQFSGFYWKALFILNICSQCTLSDVFRAQRKGALRTNGLTHFRLVFFLCTVWRHLKTRAFLIFWEGIETRAKKVNSDIVLAPLAHYFWLCVFRKTKNIRIKLFIFTELITLMWLSGLSAPPYFLENVINISNNTMQCNIAK